MTDVKVIINLDDAWKSGLLTRQQVITLLGLDTNIVGATEAKKIEQKHKNCGCQVRKLEE